MVTSHLSAFFFPAIRSGQGGDSSALLTDCWAVDFVEFHCMAVYIYNSLWNSILIILLVEKRPCTAQVSFMSPHE
jgi:hypothetical protein